MLREVLLSLLNFSFWLALPAAVLKLWRSIYRPREWEAKGRGIVITGASSGIGEELAYQYAKQGSRLVLCARREGELKAVAEKCESLGAQLVHYTLADVSKTDDCKRLMEEAAEKCGGVIDMIVLNAGISMGVPFEDVADLAIFRRLMEVNYYGCVDCTHFALPFLKKSTHAKILVISSLAGKGGVPHRSGYCASKFALHGFYETLRQELSPKYPIGVTLVCPGFVNTNINATRLGPNPTTFDISKAMPVEEAGRIIVSAVRNGKREEVFTREGKIGEWVRFFLPELYDAAAIRKIAVETKRTDQH